MPKPNGFHLAVHYFDFGTSDRAKKKLAHTREELTKALEFREHLKVAEIPEVEIQAVSNKIHGLMAYIENQPFFEVNNLEHRTALFDVALKLSKSKLIDSFQSKAYEEPGTLHVSLDSALSGEDKPLKHPDKRGYEKLRMQALEYIQQTAPLLLQQAIQKQVRPNRITTIYSDPNLRFTETEMRRLREIINKLKSEGKTRILVTGSEVGMCLNETMDHVQAIARELRQVAVEDCCRKNVSRGGRGMTFPMHCSLINYGDVNSPEKVRVFFGMKKGILPKGKTPIFYPKHI